MLLLAALIMWQAPDTCAFTGQVINAKTKAPVPRAEIRLSPAFVPNQNTPRREYVDYAATADAGGSYRAAGLPVGSYRLVAYKTGYLNDAMSGRTLSSEAKPCKTGATETVNLELTPQAVITGRVLDDDGEPVPFANVQVRRPGGSMVQRAMGGPMPGTNEKGEFRIAGLPAGTYIIVAEGQSAGMGMALGPNTVRLGETGPPMRPAPSYYPGTPDVAQAAPLTLAAGQELTGIEIRMVKAAAYTVKGTVVDQVTGKPPENAFVSMMRAPVGGVFMGGGGGGQVRNGEFTIRNVLPGKYILQTQGNDQQRGSSGVANVEVGNADVEGVRIVMLPPFGISGKIKLELDPPLTQPLSGQVFLDPGSQVAFRPLPPPAKVGPDGAFEFKDVHQGSYRINFNVASRGAYVAEVRAGGKAAPTLELSGPAGDIELVVRNDVGTVQGAVKDEKGEAVAAAQVVLIPVDPAKRNSRMFRFGMARNGQFTVGDIPPGEYFVLAVTQIDGMMMNDPAWLSAREKKLPKIAVKPKESVQFEAKLVDLEKL